MGLYIVKDLYYRISTIPIHLPALRERSADLELLVNYYIERYSKELGRHTITINPAALIRLKEYHWPGNIREFENVIKRAIILLKPGETEIQKEAFDYLYSDNNRSVNNFDAAIEILSKCIIDSGIELNTIEKSILNKILSYFDGKIMEAVRKTNISKDKFYRHKNDM